MDFFAQQDHARRTSRLLTLLFATAVMALIILTNVIVAAFLYYSQNYSVYSGNPEGMAGFSAYFSWARFGSIGLAVTATVALVILLRWIRLAGGGKAVAESLGATRLVPQTDDRHERRCLNVVQEMALAANMPVPAVYVMNDERGINAFAAGIAPADAIVAVTRGTIEQLKRHELQGVIAHEFSHILNGDMRLNIRLVAMLSGITFVGDVGHILLRSAMYTRTGSSRRDRNKSAAMPLLGLGLLAVGWLGGLAAGFIKAAISRQREYLADASAVQYTRSADSIGDALKVIGGYIPGTLVHAARATELSHLFFAQIEHQLWQFFATHPPLSERIRRVDPHWDGQYIKRKAVAYEDKPGFRGAGEAGVGRAGLVAAAVAAAAAAQQSSASSQPSAEDADFGPDPDALEAQTAEIHDIPLALVQHSREPLGAQALVYALLLSEQESVKRQQLAMIAETGISGLSDLVFTFAPAVYELGAPRRLPLLNMCMPALKVFSPAQYRAFKNTLLRLIRADQRTELHEWCLFQLVRHYLDPEFGKVRPSRPRFRRLQSVSAQLQLVLSVLANAGDDDSDIAFQSGCSALDCGPMQLLPPQQCSTAKFSTAVRELADCYPLLKPRILKAMATAAAADGQLNPREKEIIASVAAVMDCPTPEGFNPAGPVARPPPPR